MSMIWCILGSLLRTNSSFIRLRTAVFAIRTHNSFPLPLYRQKNCDFHTPWSRLFTCIGAVGSTLKTKQICKLPCKRVWTPKKKKGATPFVSSCRQVGRNAAIGVHYERKPSFSLSPYRHPIDDTFFQLLGLTYVFFPSFLLLCLSLRRQSGWMRWAWNKKRRLDNNKREYYG